MTRSAFLAVLLVAVPAPAAAQVGSLPSNSPFRDLEYKQELTAIAGWFVAGTDPARVAPQSGPMLGARYDVRIGGPAMFTARFATVWSERRLIDPSRTGAARELGVREQGLYLGDVGITMNLTGNKSWNDLVPYVTFGAGVASDFRGRDVGGYRFGTTFAFNAGGGVRWVPADRWQLRADVTDWLYQIEYPDAYYIPTASSSNDAVLRSGQSKQVWKHNLGLSLGASYAFFR